MQLKAQRPEPLNEAGPQLSGLLLGVAVDDHIIRVTLERTAGVFPVHPLVERIVHEEVREQRRDRRSLWGSPLSRRVGSVSHRHGGFEPPFDVEQHPTLVGVVSDRLHEQIMGNAVKEGPDIEIEHPVLVPTTLASHGQRAVGASPRPVSVAVGMEDRLKLLFQQHRSRGLSHPVCHIRHTENPDPGPMILRYLNRSHRPREIAPRRHPIPQLVEVVHLVGREIVDAHSVHARRSTVRSDLLPRLENETLRNFKRLQLLLLRSICRFLPRRVGLQTTVNCPAPSLGPHYRALTATTGRSAPVPRIGTLALAVFAACGSPSRGQKPWPSLSGRQVLLFHASACDELTPPIHRAPSGPHTGSSPTEGPPRRAFVPRPPTDPGFDAIVVSFRCVSSGSHMFVFSSHTCPANSETSTAALTTPALDRRSLRWFGVSACTATPEDLPPSLAQHGSCRRSSTSSSLPFRTHVGAGNSAVVGDLPRCGPMLSPRVPHCVPLLRCAGSPRCAFAPL